MQRWSEDELRMSTDELASTEEQVSLIYLLTLSKCCVDLGPLSPSPRHIQHYKVSFWMIKCYGADKITKVPQRAPTPLMISATNLFFSCRLTSYILLRHVTMKHSACCKLSKGAGSFQPRAVFKGNFIFEVDMVLLQNLIHYSLSLHPCPVSLKWSEWSVMWNYTGFPSPTPAGVQESPPECQHPAKPSLTLLRPLAFWQTCSLFSVASQSANTPNIQPLSGK